MTGCGGHDSFGIRQEYSIHVLPSTRRLAGVVHPPPPPAQNKFEKKVHTCGTLIIDSTYGDILNYTESTWLGEAIEEQRLYVGTRGASSMAGKTHSFTDNAKAIRNNALGVSPQRSC